MVIFKIIPRLLLVSGISLISLYAQSFTDIYPRPDLPCSGQVLNQYNFSAILPSGIYLYALDSGIPSPATGMPKGWTLQTSDSGDYFLAATSWFFPAETADNSFIFLANLANSPICLSFRAWSLDADYPEKLEIWVAPGDVGPEHLLQGTQVHVFQELTNSKRYHTVDLSAFAGQSVWIGFRHTSYDKFIIGLDDIRLSQIPANDVGIEAAGFQHKPSRGDTMDIQFWLSNRGAALADTFSVEWSISSTGLQGTWYSTGDTLRTNESLLVRIPEVWVPDQNGSYTLCTHMTTPDQYTGNDSLCFNEVVEFAVSTKEYASNPYIKIYPQPAQEILNIETEGTWSIYTIDSKIIYHSSEISGSGQVNVRGWPAGLYILKYGIEETLARKILIQQY